MIMAYFILISLLLFSLWLFFIYSPRKSNLKTVVIYNSITIVIAVVLSVAYSLYLRASMINGSDFGWWPVLSFMFSLVITISILIVSGILRNLLIFRHK